MIGWNPAGALGRRRAFSLIELLAVISIFATLTALTAFGWSQWARSRALSKGGAMVMSLLETARQAAITRRTTSALVVLTGGDESVSYRTLAALYFDPESASWKLLTTWVQLPETVTIARDASTFFAQAPVSLSLPELVHGGNRVGPGQFHCQAFLPDGQLADAGSSRDAPTLHLVDRFGAASGDFFDVQINPLNGRTHGVQP